MTLRPQDRVVLDLVVDDTFGLWEVVWRLTTALGKTLGSPLEIAKDSVHRLRDGGLVELLVREWADDDPVPIAESGREVDLSLDSTWDEPAPDGAEVLVTATDFGRFRLWESEAQT